jgi:hypothetical protein
MNEPEWNDYLNQFKNLPSTYFQNISINTNKFCVIVEPRKHDKLISVIKNFMFLLQNKGWGLIVFHGTENENFIKNELKDWNNVIYESLGVNNLTIDMYNNLLCSSTFWSKLIHHGCEHSLIFQVDTVLLKDEVDQFIEYDYIGAPWCIKFLGVLTVGNGGLSLRNCKTMLAIIQTHPIPKHPLNEDIYFSYFLLQTPNVNIPTMDIAKRFSVETIYNEDTCGMHKPHLDKFPNREAFIDLLSVRYV